MVLLRVTYEPHSSQHAMVSPLNTLRCVHFCTTNLISIANALLRQARGYRHVSILLESTRIKLERIQVSLEAMTYLSKLDRIQSTFSDTKMQDIRDVESVLVNLQTAFSDMSKLATFPSSQGMIDDLNRINHKLHLLDVSLNQVGVMGQILTTKGGHLEGGINELTAVINRIIHSNSNAIQSMREYLEHITVNDDEYRIGSRALAHDSITSRIKTPEFHFSVGLFMLVEKQFRQAARNFHSAHENGILEASYYLGKLYYSGLGVVMSYETAFHFYQVGERYGHIPSIYEVGWCISVGHGAKLDTVAAQSYFSKAAEAGHAAAMREYGWNLLQGSNVKPNWPRAVRLLERAHKCGDPEAEMGLSECYEHGLVVDRNSKKTFDIMLRAYEAGTLWSDTHLARCYKDGIGTKQDLVKAAEIYRRIYERGGWEGKLVQARYAMCLIRGRGVKQDITRGFDIMKNGLDDSCSIGWRLYGECFRYGYGIQKNLQKAVECYTKACSASIGESDRAKSHYRLAQIYESGKCLPLHPGKAVHHYKYAADHLIAPAQMKMGLLLEAGKGIDVDKYRAFHYFHVSARNGHLEGQKKASAYFMKGMGVQRDRSNAIRYLTQAALTGDPEAKKMLRKARNYIFLRLPRRTTV